MSQVRGSPLGCVHHNCSSDDIKNGFLQLCYGAVQWNSPMEIPNGSRVASE